MAKVRGFLDAPEAVRKHKTPEQTAYDAIMAERAEVKRLGDVNIRLAIVAIILGTSTFFLAVKVLATASC